MSTNEDIGERLRSERTRLRVTQGAFAEVMGVGKNTQLNYENGSRSPDASYLARAAAAGIDVSFVVTGQRVEKADEDRGFVLIPLFSDPDGAGNDLAVEEELRSTGLSLSRQWLAKRRLDAAQLRVIAVRGDSMQPMLSDGDRVLVDLGDTQPRSGSVCVLRQGEALMVKHCQMLPGNVLRVSSSNPAYPPYDVELEKQGEVSILGRVVGSMHDW